jgi:phosphoserine aminotransferase
MAAETIALPLEDAQMLLNWMEETFGNDGGVDWLDEDAAAVGDALYKAIDNFKAMREAIAGVRESGK